MDIGMNLLMDRNPEPDGGKLRDLEHLRVSEPEIPEGSELPRLYKWMEIQ